MDSFSAITRLRVQGRRWLNRRLLCLVIMLMFVDAMTAFACELNESSSAEQKIFRRHLVGSCTPEEREKLAISTDVLLQALQDGKSLDLLGVTITGDLMLDQLPLRPMNETTLPLVVAQQIVAERHIQNGRIIQGEISIRDSVVQGSWATNLRDGTLMIMGDTHITGTIFQRSVDFSKTAFLKTVNFSHSTIRFEGFFIGARFEEETVFEGVTFGTHSRFHKAHFKQNVSFLESQFTGLAEFLEVVFEKHANFKKTHFQMGTGFSGTQFGGHSNFSQSLFARETFFRFAVFRQEAEFRGVTFREVSDFSHTTFDGGVDFENVKFSVPPNFLGTHLEGKWQNVNKNNFLSKNAAIGFASLGLLCFLVWGVLKCRQSAS